MIAGGISYRAIGKQIDISELERRLTQIIGELCVVEGMIIDLIDVRVDRQNTLIINRTI